MKNLTTQEKNDLNVCVFNSLAVENKKSFLSFFINKIKLFFQFK